MLSTLEPGGGDGDSNGQVRGGGKGGDPSVNRQTLEENLGVLICLAL